MGAALGAGLGLLFSGVTGYERQKAAHQYAQEEREAGLMTQIFAKHPEFIETKEGQSAFKRLFGPDAVGLAQGINETRKASMLRAQQQGLIPAGSVPASTQMIGGAGGGAPAAPAQPPQGFLQRAESALGFGGAPAPSPSGTMVASAGGPTAGVPAPAAPSAPAAPPQQAVPEPSTPQQYQEWITHHDQAQAAGIIDALPDTVQKTIEERYKRYSAALTKYQEETAALDPSLAKKKGAFQRTVIEEETPAKVSQAKAIETGTAPIKVRTAGMVGAAGEAGRLGVALSPGVIAAEARKSAAIKTADIAAAGAAPKTPKELEAEQTKLYDERKTLLSSIASTTTDPSKLGPAVQSYNHRAAEHAARNPGQPPPKFISYTSTPAGYISKGKGEMNVVSPPKGAVYVPDKESPNGNPVYRLPGTGKPRYWSPEP